MTRPEFGSLTLFYSKSKPSRSSVCTPIKQISRHCSNMAARWQHRVMGGRWDPVMRRVISAKTLWFQDTSQPANFQGV
jgi:hypothetical protein